MKSDYNTCLNSRIWVAETEDCEFEVSLGYTVRPCLNTPTLRVQKHTYHCFLALKVSDENFPDSVKEVLWHKISGHSLVLLSEFFVSDLFRIVQCHICFIEPIWYALGFYMPTPLLDFWCFHLFKLSILLLSSFPESFLMYRWLTWWCT